MSEPYYAVRVASTKGEWTAKFLVVAANAWSGAQAKWLDAELGKKTTYTFVVRHEGASVKDVPGVAPSDAILAKHPYTLLLAGHVHTYAHHPKATEIIVGNGGAPLTSQVDYGYVVARQRSDGAMVFRAVDYESGKVVDSFALKPNGSAAP